MHRDWGDVRFALRGFRRTSTFFIAAVALLAVGIGAASAIFSVATTILVRGLPMRDQNSFIVLWTNARGAATEVPTALKRGACWSLRWAERCASRFSASSLGR
jgi:putative ABC transport system permease protein